MKFSRFFCISPFFILFCLATLVGSAPGLAQRPFGIDVSSYQGSADTNGATNINWTSVKTAGKTFAWAKATEGTYYIDADFVYNVTHAKTAGVPIGAYHFARMDLNTGTAGADTEAAYFWNQIKNYVTGGGYYLMPMLDAETASPGSQSAVSIWVNRWCQDLVNYGASNGVVVKPIIYTYTSWGSSYLNTTVTNWPLWMASPNGQNPATGAPSTTTPWPTGAWTIWQYGGGTVSGVSGAVDEDVFNGTASTLGSLIIGGPSISNQPVSVTVSPGTNVNFTVTAGGSGTLHYQWEFNGTNISGATATQYSIANVQLSNAGGYSVLVTNASGGILSATAFLSVVEPLTNAPGAVLAPAGLVNWWPGDGDALDVFGTANGALQGGIYYSAGKDGLAFHFDGSTASITNSAASLAVPWTACMWVNRQNTPQTSAGLLEDGTYSLKLEQYNGTHQVGLSILSVGDYIFSPAYTVPAGTWTHLAFVGTSSGTTLYVNGAVMSSLTNSIPLPRKYIGAGYITSSAKYVDFLLGSLDEIMVYNRALSTAEIHGIYAAGSAGLIRAPAFTGTQFLPNGNFQLGFEGLTGRTFTMHSSTDLVTWQSFGAISNPTGTNQFTDNSATNNPQTFYRLSQP